MFVGGRGLEPPCLAALAPKASVSTPETVCECSEHRQFRVSRYTECDLCIFVGRARLELAPLAGLAPKASAATNYATYP